MCGNHIQGQFASLVSNHYLLWAQQPWSREAGPGNAVSHDPGLGALEDIWAKAWALLALHQECGRRPSPLICGKASHDAFNSLASWAARQGIRAPGLHRVGAGSAPEDNDWHAAMPPSLPTPKALPSPLLHLLPPSIPELRSQMLNEDCAPDNTMHSYLW